MRLAFALYGHVAGIIERDAGTTTLRYLREYQLLDNPTPLSLSMPVSDVTYRRDRSRHTSEGCSPTMRRSVAAGHARQASARATRSD